MVTQTDQIISFARERGLVSPADIENAGLNPRLMRRLATQGRLWRVTRGVYAHPEHQVTSHHDLAVVAKMIPAGVFCLLTALRFHGLTTQDPHRIWIALHPRAWNPTLSDFRLQVIRMSGESLSWGEEIHKIEGVRVAIFNPAKTVADCFRFRRIIGLDVATEALREYRRDGLGTLDEVREASEVNGVEAVMKPYLEMVV